MNWEAMATAHQLIAADQLDQAARLLRDLRLHYGHPAAGTLLASALQAAGDATAAEAILTEDCALGIADHWTWLARADLATACGLGQLASEHRAQAYALLGWRGCHERGYRFHQDECSQQLPRWSRCLTLLLPTGALQMLAVESGEGSFALWALERLEARGGRITTLGSLPESFEQNLERCDPTARTRLKRLTQLDDAGLTHGERRWDWIQLGPGCLPEDGWQQRLRPLLRPQGVMLSHAPACLSGSEVLLPGVLLAGWEVLPEASQAASS